MLEWLSLIPAIAGVIVSIILLIFGSGVLPKGLSIIKKLRVIEERLSELEKGKISKTTELDASERLSRIEKAIEQIKDGPPLSSMEFNLLQYQINEIKKSKEDLENSTENKIEQKFNSFRFGFTIWMLVITLLFTFAIGLLIYLLPK
jgi:ABC-type antimicrobial peptide transport system permease subunit